MLFRLLLIATLGALAGCNGDPPTVPTPGGGLRVLATSGPVGDAVRNVLGEHGSVDVLMGPGIDPHLYREKPADLRKLSDADVVFFNGLHFEGIHDTLEKLGTKKPVFALAEPLEANNDKRLRYPEGLNALPDPHVWHDASVWADCVTEIADRLSDVDPANAADYRAAAEVYRSKLLNLHAWCQQQIASVPEDQRLMVTAHDAFGYFSDAYGIETVGLKGVSTEDEVDLGHMQGIIELVLDRQLPAVFVESSVAPRIVEALVEPCLARGHEVTIGGELYADSLGDAESGAADYVSMMQANVATVVEALGGTVEPFDAAAAAPEPAAAP